MTYGAAAIAVACFVVALDRLQVLSIARRATATARGAARVLRDASMTDDDKERSVRVAALQLGRCCGSITWRSAAAVGLSVVPVLLLQLAGVVRLSAVNLFLLSWNGLLLATATVVVLQLARSRS